VPAYASVSEAEFLDHKWQAKNSITNIAKLLAALKGWCRRRSSRTRMRGFERAPIRERCRLLLVAD
jgi:lysine 2,3-aminomutase